jgi:choline dehydrogenase-like flavoprotein
MQLSYLPYAAGHGAEVMPDERVVRIIWDGRRATGVETAKRTLVATRAVIVAASAVQSPGILARSGVRSQHLGLHFQGHPGMAIVGLFDRPVGIAQGATQGFEVDGLRTDSNVKLETLAVPPETFFGGMPGVGSDWLSMMGEFDRSAVWVLPLRARSEGSVRTRGDQARIAFRIQPADIANLRRGLLQAVRLMLEAGAREVVCPVHGLPDRLRRDQVDLISTLPDEPGAYPLAMSHLFGTVRMSPTPAGGVVGTDFRVHGTENLYVIDSSVFPTNLGVNPQLTIMALARIAAHRIAA